jgi:hypothetical protein
MGGLFYEGGNSMQLYQASLFLNILKYYYEIFREPLNVLLSFAIMGSDTKGFLDTHRHMVKSIIVDSGAWSVAKGKSDLTIEQLISYLQLWGWCFARYFNFDTDFSDQGFENNIANQIQMEQAGLNPIPVVHNFYDREIDYYIDKGKYEWLALGSSQSTKFKAISDAVDRIKKRNPSIKIHWFGGSTYDWLCQLPIASCDTSSWAKAGVYGFITYWNPYEDSFNKTHRIYISGPVKPSKRNEYHFVTYRWRKDLEEYLYNTFGYTYQQLCGYGDKYYMQVVNTRFYVELECRINEERLKNGIPLE